MITSYLPIEPFEVEKVQFYIIGSIQPPQGGFASIYKLISTFTGRKIIDLKLVALTDHMTAGNFMEMNQMEEYGKKYLRQAKQLALRQGFMVIDTHWGGIIHPDNLAICMKTPNCVVLEFLPVKYTG